MSVAHPFNEAHRPVWLKRLELHQFRSFENFSIDFHPALTVIVAPNGVGKTAILDGIALALRYFVDRMLGAASSRGFAGDDVRRLRTPEAQMVQQYPVSLLASARIENRDLTWQRDLAGPGSKTSVANAGALAALAADLRGQLQDYSSGKRSAPPELPVVAYYGPGRGWSEEGLSWGRRKLATNLTEQVTAYAGCLSAAANYATFALWFERVCREAQSERTQNITSPHRPLSLLQCVRGATDEVLRSTAWGRLDWDFVIDEIVAEHPVNGRLPVSLLSDGIRNVLAMTADLAHRCVRLNPHYGGEAAKHTSGIVLIDEVDMHLHPEWQQTILDSLMAAFPRVQFIVSTHSPQVLSTVDVACVRVLGADGQVETRTRQTRGVESTTVLADVMNVDPIPPVAEAGWVADYQAAVESGEAAGEVAQELWAKIVAHFGDQHPVVKDCERLLRWQTFKSKPSGQIRSSD